MLAIYPIILGIIIDYYTAEKFQSIDIFLGFYFSIGVLTIIFYPITAYYLSTVNQKTRKTLLLEWTNNLLSKDSFYLSKHHRGKIVESFQRSADMVEMASENIISFYIPNIIKIVIILGYIVYINGYIVLPITVITCILIIKISFFYKKKLRLVIDDANKSKDRYKSYFLDIFRNAQQIKLVGAHQSSLRWFQTQLKIHHKNKIHQGYYHTYTEFLGQFLIWLSQTLIFIFGAYAIKYGFTSVSTGDIVAMYLYSSLLIQAVLALTEINFDDAQYSSADNSLKQILSVPDRKQLTLLYPSKSSFCYDLKLDLVKLPYVNLSNQETITIPFRSKLHIRSDTSTKKILLAKIISGISTPSLSVFVGENDLSKLGLNQLSKIIFYSPQQYQMLSGNFYQSVLWADFNYCHQDLCDKLALLQLNKFCQFVKNPDLSFPSQHLSFGERKRLSLFRAMVYKRPITILENPVEGCDLSLTQRLWSLIHNYFDFGTLICIDQSNKHYRGFDLSIHLTGNNYIHHQKL